MVDLALGLGIALNLLFTEVLGLSSGGLVVPGYLALHLTQPSRLLATLALGGATFATVRYGLMRLVVLYGRRRFGVTILTGFVLHGLYTLALSSTPAPADLRVVGYIVPGLIANTSLSQGFWSTVAATLTIAILVRLILWALGPFLM
jgi:poly-gamma-glutamate biosynthesis protein PgsC/CapC